MSNWELMHTEMQDGFEIHLHFTPEDDAPEGYFASGDDAADAELCARIHSGVWLWFVARVTASKAGIALGTSYLGACCYASAAEFIDCSFDDMALDAIAEARDTLAKLAA
jgi:hypothetical protein